MSGGRTRKIKQRKAKGEMWKCDVCSKVFAKHAILVSHLHIHSEEKNYLCEVCGKANLKHHIYTHTQERPYKCDICSKGFNQMSNLTRHKLKTHGIVQRYECHICGKSFKIREHCQRHELYDHADRPKDPSSKSTTDKSNMADGDRDDIPNLPANTMKYIIDPINTEAMRVSRALNQQPLLVLFQPLDGVPVIMRVYEDGENQRLEPAAWTDVCRYSQIHDINESERQQDDPNAPEKFEVDLKLPIAATIHEITAAED